jgi:tRNA (guanine-N7-)-methyltransferase
VSDGHRRHQFYGRRKGHALRRHHLDLVTNLLPRLRFDAVAFAAAPPAAACLEIGFGGGEHLAHMAALDADVFFVGAEPFLNGVAKLLAIIEDRQLRNIRIHDGDARELFDALPAAVFDRIYLLYPDPWPKARHHRRRFVNADNLSHMHRLLKPDGLFLFASDIDDYVQWTLEHVAAHGGFSGPIGDTGQAPDHWIQTRYEAKARREGRSSAYLLFRRQEHAKKIAGGEEPVLPRPLEF